MKKRIISLLVAIVLVFSQTGVFASGTGDVEIKFCVGDDTLMINGEPVTVSKPYVVGEGVTLVPVRVITEAFGAKVDWIGETRTVTLTYPDVNIVLQIDNVIAEVNGRAETLLAAPELTNNYTMVPLRFISENFGADVSYDSATGGITVTKKADNGGSVIVGTVDKKFIGDSYYKWSIENPKDMKMSTRYFDGTFTEFAYDENNWIDITVFAKGEDYDFEKEFSEWKTLMKDLTLVVADNNTSDPEKKIMHIQAKNKTETRDIYEIETRKYIYRARGGFENEKTEIKDEGLRILSTFDAAFVSGDIHDLSNVKDGVRRFEAETINLSVDIPEDYILISSEDAVSSFAFGSILPDDTDSFITIDVYSKNSVGSSAELADRDYNLNKKYLNDDVTKFFEMKVVKKEYKNMVADTYSYEYHTTDKDVYIRDVFFEKGEYVYNVAVRVKLPNGKKAEFADSIINSIVAEEIDFEKVGPILYNAEVSEDVYQTGRIGKCIMQIPTMYQEVAAGKDTIAYATAGGGRAFVITMLSNIKYTTTNIKLLVEETERELKNTYGAVKLHETKKEMVGETIYTVLRYRTVEDDAVVFTELYAISHDAKAYLFLATYSELEYSQHAKELARRILRTIKFE